MHSIVNTLKLGSILSHPFINENCFRTNKFEKLSCSSSLYGVNISYLLVLFISTNMNFPFNVQFEWKKAVSISVVIWRKLILFKNKYIRVL